MTTKTQIRQTKKFPQAKNMPKRLCTLSKARNQWQSKSAIKERFGFMKHWHRGKK